MTFREFLNESRSWSTDSYTTRTGKYETISSDFSVRGKTLSIEYSNGIFTYVLIDDNGLAGKTSEEYKKSEIGKYLENDFDIDLQGKDSDLLDWINSKKA